jgi:hypothetical protein
MLSSTSVTFEHRYVYVVYYGGHGSALLVILTPSESISRLLLYNTHGIKTAITRQNPALLIVRCIQGFSKGNQFNKTCVQLLQKCIRPKCDYDLLYLSLHHVPADSVLSAQRSSARLSLFLSHPVAMKYFSTRGDDKVLSFEEVSVSFIWSWSTGLTPSFRLS